MMNVFIVAEKREYFDLFNFETGQLPYHFSWNKTLEDLREHAIKSGEPEQISGQQELYEAIIAASF